MTNCIKHKAVERIWLVLMAEDGELGYVWCDDPAPGEGMDPADAVEYVRRDAHDARISELEQERDALASLFVKLQDAAISLIHASNVEEVGDAIELIAGCSEQEARNILSRRDLLKQAEVLEDHAGLITGEHVEGGLMQSAEALRQQADQLEID